MGTIGKEFPLPQIIYGSVDKDSGYRGLVAEEVAVEGRRIILVETRNIERRRIEGLIKADKLTEWSELNQESHVEG